MSNLIKEGEALASKAEAAIEEAQGSSDPERVLAANQLSGYLSGLRMTMQTLQMEPPGGISAETVKLMQSQMVSRFRQQSAQIEEQLRKIE